MKRIGCYSDDPMNLPTRTLKEVADVLGISHQEVSRVEAIAFRKLRTALADFVETEYAENAALCIAVAQHRRDMRERAMVRNIR